MSLHSALLVEEKRKGEEKKQPLLFLLHYLLVGNKDLNNLEFLVENSSPNFFRQRHCLVRAHVDVAAVA